jgi:hypothetical protein
MVECDYVYLVVQFAWSVLWEVKIFQAISLFYFLFYFLIVKVS